MSVRLYVPIDTYDLPESFEYALDGTTYLFTVNYNDEGDFFTIDIDDQNGHVLRGEKLVLNVPLFSSYYYEWLPTTPLIPMDESGQATYCGIQELGAEHIGLHIEVRIELGESPHEGGAGFDPGNVFRGKGPLSHSHRGVSSTHSFLFVYVILGGFIIGPGPCDTVHHALRGSLHKVTVLGGEVF